MPPYALETIGAPGNLKSEQNETFLEAARQLFKDSPTPRTSTTDTWYSSAEKHLPNGFGLFGFSSEKTQLSPGDHRFSTLVDGHNRSYEVHLPPNYDGQKPIPVMFVLPGMGGSIDQMKHETGMNRAADQHGFAVVYVEALPKGFPGSFGLAQSASWNLDHGSLTDKDSSYDDLNYIKEVNRALGNQVNVDTAAKYIVGFSEGGGASQFIAESMPGTFAGVGSVHGTRLDSDPHPRYGDKTAFVTVLGDDDNMLPLEGGHGWGEGWRPLKGFTTISVPRVAESKPLSQKEAWATADGCGMPMVTDDGKNKRTEYFCPGSKVTEIIRHGGMHAWDGLGQNANNYKTGIPDFGWSYIGVPNPKESTTNDVINSIMPYRKDGRYVDMRKNFLNQ